MKQHLLCLLLLLACASLCAQNYWTGAVSTDWNNASNWTAGVPTATHQVLIQTVASARYPVINTTDAVCQKLSLLAGASLTIGTADLTVGDYALIWGQLNMNSPTDLVAGSLLHWLEGSTVNVTNSSAEIYIGNRMAFDAGSNVQFSAGYIEFSSTAGLDNYLTNNSANTILPTVRSRNSTGIFHIHGDTTEDIVINGNFHNYENCSFQCANDVNLIVKGDFKDDNTVAGRGVWLTQGTVVMDGIAQGIQLTSQSMLNNLTCSSSNTVNLVTDLFLRGTLTIDSGSFNADGHDIRIRGDWVNLVGPAAFSEAGSTVTFEADWDQYCNYDEDFDHLKLNKVADYVIVNSSSADVSCASYEWVNGGIKVLAGSFSALSLVNNYIAGEWFLQTGGSINLSNYGDYRYIDLGGSLTISGGIFNVYGGAISSWWPYPNDASITMSGGTLDFKDQGVSIVNTASAFSSNITGGTIRVARSFIVNRAGFNPISNLIVLAGSTDCEVSHVAGSSFYSLDINKYLGKDDKDQPKFETGRDGSIRELTRSQTVTAASDLDINGYFVLRAGYFTAPAQMNVRGDWYKYTSHDSFIEGAGKVVFDSNANSSVYGGEDFHTLELAKSTLAWELRIPSTGEAECDSYVWTQGTLAVSGGLFYAHDMVDAVIQGTVNLSGGNITLVQDTATSLGLRGNLNISGGEFHIFGGTPDVVSAIPSGGNASFTMSDGLFYRHGWGIGIYNSAYTFSENITGGIIRTDGNFYCDRTEFTPAGGTLELTGTAETYLTMVAGTLHALRTNKPDAWVKLMTDVTASGTITVQTGILDLNANDLHADGGVVVYGILHIDDLASLRMGNMKYLNVESGGLLQAWGSDSAMTTIICDSGYFYLNVFDGGTISARNCIFSAISQYGVYLRPGAVIDPNNSFFHCYFSWGQPGGTLLRIDNSDNVVIRDAVFATNAGGGASNVRKTVDTGIVNFINALGVFSGEDFDDDIHNRVFWNAGTDLPDLQILRAEWIPASPNPYLGDYRDLKVTVVNNSIYPLTGVLFYVDLYYDRDDAPPIQVWGNVFLELNSLQAGLPVDVYFSNVTNYVQPPDGEWSTWLQIDADERVNESQEYNNIYGPFQTIWQDLPPITDLSIAYDPLEEMATLSWNYPLSVTKFNVYLDSDPLGAFTSYAGWSTTHSYSFSPGQTHFFRVTAERLPPSKVDVNPPRIRN